MSRPNNVFEPGERVTQSKDPYLFRCLVTLLAVLSIVGSASLHAAPKKVSAIISIGKDGRLVYGLDEKGNRVPDFSTCGYAGGGQQIPEVEVRVVVAPVPGDETARIQKALDDVGALPADTNGFRGAVLLLKGWHEVSGALQMTRPGVVLRGQGMSEEGTILVATGTDRRTLIRITGQNDLSAHSNAGWKIAEDYVPVGATSFHLISTEGLALVTRFRFFGRAPGNGLMRSA